MGIFIRNDVIPNMYKTYLDEEDCDNRYEALTQEDFLRFFGLKNISNTTVWKWMKFIGFTYDE